MLNWKAPTSSWARYSLTKCCSYVWHFLRTLSYVAVYVWIKNTNFSLSQAFSEKKVFSPGLSCCAWYFKRKLFYVCFMSRLKAPTFLCALYSQRKMSRWTLLWMEMLRISCSIDSIWKCPQIRVIIISKWPQQVSRICKLSLNHCTHKHA